MKFVIRRDGKLKNRIQISKTADGRLCAAVPSNMAMIEVQKYLEKHAQTIARRFFRSVDFGDDFESDVIVDKPTSLFYTYQQTMIFGVPVKISCSSAKQKATLAGGVLHISEKYHKDVQLRKKAVQDFLKKTARDIMGKKVAQAGRKIRMCPTQIEFKSMKEGVWFSCADACDRVFSIDFRAIQLPESLQEFIILHCFSHFYEPSHSKRFSNVLSNFLPNHQQLQQQLTYYEFLKDL